MSSVEVEVADTYIYEVLENGNHPTDDRVSDGAFHLSDPREEVS